MSASPSDGVVDQNLGVHGVPNLYVASSSTFVTSGQANSTFMVVVFALRLVDHLARQLRVPGLQHSGEPMRRAMAWPHKFRMRPSQPQSFRVPEV